MRSKSRKVMPGGRVNRKRTKAEIAQRMQGLRQKKVVPATLHQYVRERAKQKKFWRSEERRR